ncbi:hypothetical protein BC629DRAFT_1444325 [Irpex lacteus]|nr:hypothetical protein BC629DRAFT_1444325 [Irpex lacteus]
MQSVPSHSKAHEAESGLETFDLNVSGSDGGTPAASTAPSSRSGLSGASNLKRAGRRQKSPSPSLIPQPQKRGSGKSTDDVWTFVEKGSNANRCNCALFDLYRHEQKGQPSLQVAVCDEAGIEISGKVATQVMKDFRAKSSSQPDFGFKADLHERLPFSKEAFVNALADWIVADDQDMFHKHLSEIERDITARCKRDGVPFRRVERQIRCFPHIVNLACQVILKEMTNMDLAKDNAEDRPPTGVKPTSVSAAITRDSVATLRALIHSIRASSLRRSGFQNTLERLGHLSYELLRDVETRWLSTYFTSAQIPFCSFRLSLPIVAAPRAGLAVIPAPEYAHQHQTQLLLLGGEKDKAKSDSVRDSIEYTGYLLAPLSKVLGRTGAILLCASGIVNGLFSSLVLRHPRTASKCIALCLKHSRHLHRRPEFSEEACQGIWIARTTTNAFEITQDNKKNFVKHSNFPESFKKDITSPQWEAAKTKEERRLWARYGIEGANAAKAMDGAQQKEALTQLLDNFDGFKLVSSNIALIRRTEATPLIRSYIQLYPEVSADDFSEVWHCDKWRRDIDSDALLPMYDAGEWHYYANEIALLQDGFLAIPCRWVIYQGTVHAKSRILLLNNDGNVTIYENAPLALIPADDMIKSYHDLQSKNKLPTWGTEPKQYGSATPNPLHKIANVHLPVPEWLSSSHVYGINFCLVRDTHSKPVDVHDVLTGEGNLFCRKCDTEGTNKEKESTEGFEHLFKPGAPRSKDHILASLRSQVKVACTGVVSRVK